MYEWCFCRTASPLEYRWGLTERSLSSSCSVRPMLRLWMCTCSRIVWHLDGTQVMPKLGLRLALACTAQPGPFAVVWASAHLWEVLLWPIWTSLNETDKSLTFLISQGASSTDQSLWSEHWWPGAFPSNMQLHIEGRHCKFYVKESFSYLCAEFFKAPVFQLLTSVVVLNWVVYKHFKPELL